MHKTNTFSSVVAEFKCTCKARRILSATGCYSMIRLLGQCGGWHSDIIWGTDWAVFDRAVEDGLGACQLIATTCNHSSSGATACGHAEILRTLVSLIDPSPERTLYFRHVRDRLAELYGNEVDHPDLKQCYEVLVKAGGMSSPIV